MIPTLSPERCTAPSTTASTPSSLAICGSNFFVPLYCITEVREITLSALICANSVISASVMPSAKYSCSGSCERFSSGSTASDRIPLGSGLPNKRLRNPPALKPVRSATRKTQTRPSTPAPRSTNLQYLDNQGWPKVTAPSSTSPSFLVASLPTKSGICYLARTVTRAREL